MTGNQQQSIQNIIEQTSGTATYVGATGTLIWGLSADEWTAIGVIIGLVFTAATFVVNWIYRHKTWKALHKKD